MHPLTPTQFPVVGFFRLDDIIGRPATKNDPGTPALIPVSASTWWQMVRDGRAPKSYTIGHRCTVWKISDILALIEATAPKAQE